MLWHSRIHKSSLLFKNPLIKSFALFLRCVSVMAMPHRNSSHHKLLLLYPCKAWDQLHELNYRAKKSLSGIKIQGIDGAMDTVQLSIVSSPVNMSISSRSTTVTEGDQWQQPTQNTWSFQLVAASTSKKVHKYHFYMNTNIEIFCFTSWSYKLCCKSF